MARQKSGSVPQSARLSIEDKRRAIPKLERELKKLRELDIFTISRGDDLRIKSIETSIEMTLAGIFGLGTHQYNLFIPAARLDRTSYRISLSPSFGRGGGGTSVEEIRQGVERGRQQAVSLLQQAVDTLREEVADGEAIENETESRLTAASEPPKSQVTGSTVTINPTIYSFGPNAQIQVGQQNSISVDRGTPAFADFEHKMATLFAELRGANDLPTDVKEQVSGELRAGMELIKTPKPDKTALQTYLLKPLQWLTKEFVSGTVRHAASLAIAALASIAATLFVG